MAGRHDYARDVALLARKFSLKFLVLLLFLPLLSLPLRSSALAQSVIDGGLTVPEIGGSIGPNLLVNGNFAQGTTGWSFPATCFHIDPTTTAPNGAAAFELINPSTCSHLAAVAVNSLDVPGGALYRFSGQLKTKDLVSAENTDGAIFSLFGYARSQALRGTTNWITVTRPHVTIPAGITSDVRLQTYGQVLTGDAWFANMSLQQEIPPVLQTFLLYPNYRGLMFSDQSQVASVDLTINPLPGTSLNTLRVELDALDSTGHTVASQTFAPPSNEFTGTLDMSGLPPGAYKLVGKLENQSGKLLLTQSAYKIVKVDASTRAGMKAWIDPDNLAHFIDGNAHFVIGIYDTTAASSTPSAYEPELAAIAQAPINMIINYFLSNSPTSAITAYTTAMNQFGIAFLPDLQGFYTGNHAWPSQVAAEFGTNNANLLTTDYVSTLASDPGVVGYYVQDEPAITLQPATFRQYGLTKSSDPAGFNLAVLNRTLDLPAWKDTLDVLGVDAYPIFAANGNDLAEVADRTRAAYQAGHGARPVWTVVQFFQQNLESAWPTEQQLHDMSWMAIVEGATGLFYWEYGIRGLALVTDPVEHAALYQELIDVTTEIKSLEPVLLSPDAPVITTNSQSGVVFTKTKVAADGTRYLFAYNYTASPISAQFALVQPATSIVDYDTGVSIALDSSTTFSDTFQPYQARIFAIAKP